MSKPGPWGTDMSEEEQSALHDELLAVLLRAVEVRGGNPTVRAVRSAVACASALSVVIGLLPDAATRATLIGELVEHLPGAVEECAIQNRSGKFDQLIERARRRH